METIKKVFSQSLYQLLGKAVSALSTLFALSIIARIYGKEGTGVFTLATTYLAFFYLAVDLGLNAYVLPKLSESKLEASKLYSLRLILSVILVFLANIILQIMPFNTPLLSQAVLIGSGVIIFSGMINSANLIFQKSLRYDLSVFGWAINALLTFLIILYLSTIGATIPYLLLGPLLGYLAGALISSLLVSKYQKLTFVSINSDYLKSLLTNSWPISATMLLNVVYFRVDSFMISTYHGLSQAGIYNLSYQFFQTALVLPTFIMNGFYPFMLESLEKGKGYLFKQLKIAGLILLGIAILGIFLTHLLSPFLINLVAGSEFEDSVRVLNILSLGFPAYFLSALLMWVMVTFKKYKEMFYIYLAGLLVNFFLNLYFIPRASYIGAAVITGVCEYLILFLQLIILIPIFKKSHES